MKRKALLILFLFPQFTLLIGQDSIIVRKHLRVSTNLEELAAVEYGEDIVVYMSQVASVGISSPVDNKGRKLFTVFQCSKSGTKKPFNKNIFSVYNEGPVSFTSDFKSMVFSQQRPGINKNEFVTGLFFSKFINGKWSNISPYEYNDPSAKLFSPSFSTDGNTLFFSADFEGGYGGYDLYFSELIDGSWTPPKNLGPTVNSEKNELYPFFHSSGQLFFSSDGHDDSKAGFDLFECSFQSGKCGSIQKMGAPINSTSNDMHVYFSEDFKRGFLTSDREGKSKDIFIIEPKNP